MEVKIKVIYHLPDYTGLGLNVFSLSLKSVILYQKVKYYETWQFFSFPIKYKPINPIFSNYRNFTKIFRLCFKVQGLYNTILSLHRHKNSSYFIMIYLNYYCHVTTKKKDRPICFPNTSDPLVCQDICIQEVPFEKPRISFVHDRLGPISLPSLLSVGTSFRDRTYGSWNWLCPFRSTVGNLDFISCTWDRGPNQRYL